MTTDTRLRRPIHLTKSPVSDLTLADITRLHEQPAEPPTVEFEHARVLPREWQRTEPGRHRAPETRRSGEPEPLLPSLHVARHLQETGQIPKVPPAPEPESWLPGEGPTRMLVAVPPSFPRVLPGPSPRRAALLAHVMRAAQRLRGVLGGVR